MVLVWNASENVAFTQHHGVLKSVCGVYFSEHDHKEADATVFSTTNGIQILENTLRERGYILRKISIN